MWSIGMKIHTFFSTKLYILYFQRKSFYLRSQLGINNAIDLQKTKLKFMKKPEKEVFGSFCPLENPLEAGFRGNCNPKREEFPFEIQVVFKAF